MNKYETLCKFYNSFGIPAFEEFSVPEKAEMPYIKYDVVTSSVDSESTALSLQIYYKSNNLIKIDDMTEKLSKALRSGVTLPCDEGYIVLYRGEPFSQNVDSGDKTVKCKYINITANFITL